MDKYTERMFLNSIIDLLNESNMEAEYVETSKSDGIHRGIGVMDPTSGLQARFYIENLRGMSPEEAVEWIKNARVAPKHARTLQTAINEHNFELIKNMLTLQAINLSYPSSAETLDKAPYIKVEGAEDIGVICWLEDNDDHMTGARMLVTHEVMNMFNVVFNITKEGVFETAKATVRNNIVFTKLSGIIRGMFDVEDDAAKNENSIYILYNPMTSTSGVISDRKTLEKIRKQIGDFYIIPSSIHELLVVKKGITEIGTKEMIDLIKEVNTSCVSPDDRLSDKLYEFNGCLSTVK